MLMNTEKFEIPILLITFNRPVHTQKVLVEIIKQNPNKLYIFQDGPRDYLNSDKEKCKEVRSLILNTFNLLIESKVYFSNINLGCGLGPKTAIDWFFENEVQGIIIEDDCLPNYSFFTLVSINFC